MISRRVREAGPYATGIILTTVAMALAACGPQPNGLGGTSTSSGQPGSASPRTPPPGAAFGTTPLSDSAGPAGIPGPPATALQAHRYVALGDSYTIGTSVRSGDRWPDQLVRQADGRLQLVANLGVNGYTSGDVVDLELPQLDGLAPEFVSLLIGVNDVVQGVSEARYRANVTLILERLLVRLPADRVVVIATPDYTVTPQGAAFGDPGQQSAGIRRNNEILRELAMARGIAFVDIYDISLRAAVDGALVASDGLHPSRTQYALWVDRIGPVVRGLLAQP